MKTAHISACGRFRYRLGRSWAPGAPLCFVMLNPSTADASEDDPTIRKCMGFAKRLGYSGIEVVNLFAYRATDPRELKKAGFLRGPENDDHIVAACKESAATICAWGAHARGLVRPLEVTERLHFEGIRPMALALTEDGIPRHPLMLGYDSAKLQPYNPAAFARASTVSTEKRK